MKTYQNKVVLVTGAGSGIGKASALAFGREGASVIVSDINEDAGMKTVVAIKNCFGEATFIKCDVSKDLEVKNLIESSIKKYGKIDCAFNNAGIEEHSTSTLECTEETWTKILDTNLKSVWLCLKYEILSMLKTGGGSIVNCSSIAGLVGFPNIPAYVASKHGVIGLTEATSLEFAKKNIRVNSVCPGPIHTPMLERLSKEQEKELAEKDPMGRIGTPEEIAETVLWLCSDKASYITGQSMAIDGGWVVQ
jgi:NAD(P)-dependent dehydrogenase (short-subunit alcohol dehydrogenase family)